MVLVMCKRIFVIWSCNPWMLLSLSSNVFASILTDLSCRGLFGELGVSLIEPVGNLYCLWRVVIGAGPKMADVFPRSLSQEL